MSQLPYDVTMLFWEVDPGAVDLERHRDYVLERVMSRGGWEAMRWLRGAYPVDQLREFLVSHGARLCGRDFAYWALIAGLEVEAPAGGGRPRWADA